MIRVIRILYKLENTYIMKINIIEYFHSLITGSSSEIYFFGSQLTVKILGAFWGVLIYRNLILPVLYPLDILSIYQVD